MQKVGAFIFKIGREMATLQGIMLVLMSMVMALMLLFIVSVERYEAKYQDSKQPKPLLVATVGGERYLVEGAHEVLPTLQRLATDGSVQVKNELLTLREEKALRAQTATAIKKLQSR